MLFSLLQLLDLIMAHREPLVTADDNIAESKQKLPAGAIRITRFGSTFCRIEERPRLSSGAYPQRFSTWYFELRRATPPVQSPVLMLWPT